VGCLNKVDIGSPEKIVLMSRDEMNILVTSFKDIQNEIGDAFSELVRTSVA